MLSCMISKTKKLASSLATIHGAEAYTTSINTTKVHLRRSSHAKSEKFENASLTGDRKA